MNLYGVLLLSIRYFTQPQMYVFGILKSSDLQNPSFFDLENFLKEFQGTSIQGVTHCFNHHLKIITSYYH